MGAGLQRAFAAAKATRRTNRPALTELEIDVILGMVGDVDPAHFEAWEEPERTRREKAYERAKAKLEASR